MAHQELQGEQLNKGFRRFVRPALQAGLVVSILVYFGWKIDWAAFTSTLLRIDYLSFSGFMLGFVACMLLADAFAIHHVMSRYVSPTRFRDVVIARGSSYLPSVLNYHLGQAALTWLLSQGGRVPLGRVAGATLVGYASMFGSITVLAATSYLLRPSHFTWLGPVLLTIGLSACLYLAALRFARGPLSQTATTGVLIEAGASGHFLSVLERLPHAAVLFLGSWIPFGYFGVTIPPIDALALVPIVLLVGAMPLTPQGIGTRELVAVQLLSPYAPGSQAERTAAVVACCVVWAISLSVIEAVMALVLGSLPKPVFPQVGGTNQ